MLDYRERKELRDYLEEKRLARRLIIVRVFFVLLFSACFAGLYYLQVMQREQYQALADYNRMRKVVIHPHRGNIYDRHGRSLVANRPSHDVILDREKLGDVERIVKLVAPILGLDEVTLRERIERYRSRPAFEPAILKEDVSFQEIAYLESRRWEIPEISITSETRRSYPAGSMLAHLVGYVGEARDDEIARSEGTIQMGDIVGRSGLERAYESQLRGRRGEQLLQVNSVGRPIGQVLVGTPPQPGNDLYLSLDFDLQRTLVEAFGSEVGAGVFLDPRNGEILALASQPAFDPNLFASRFSAKEWRAIEKDPLHPLQNRAISSTYSPGSTFKLAVAVAGLEEGVVDEGTAVYCGGGAYFYGRRYGCWKKEGHGVVTLHRAIVQSCNVFFYTVGQRLGIDRIAHFASGLGFGSTTGVDLTNEKAGLVPSNEWSQSARHQPWYAGETISVSIGQGPMLVTPLQMANMAACVANAGKVYRPRIVRPAPGVSAPPELIHEIRLSPHTLDVIRKAMWGVVNESGTGGKARLPDVEVAGKTGTVQVFKASAGVDSDKLSKEMRDHAWFVGFAPMKDPKIAFAVFVEHGGHGGEISAPIVRKVLEVYFSKGRRPDLGVPVNPQAPAAPPPLVARATSPQ